MSKFADKVIRGVKEKGSPCVVGLDYFQDKLPDFVRSALEKAPNENGYRTALGDFFRLIIESVAPHVALVKPQDALISPMTNVGAQIFGDLVRNAQGCGLLVIADAKRGDIASSAEGYAETFIRPKAGPSFAQGYNADAVTVNPFLGRDTLTPFLEACSSLDKGIFILVKTSNKGSVETQDRLLAEDNQPIYMAYARMVAELGVPHVGERGYSSVGAVVGATFPDQARQIRQVMPQTIILVPGYGAQGATADDVAVNFNEDGLGAIVNASRSITYNFPRPDISRKAYGECVSDNLRRMTDDIMEAIHRRGIA